MNFFEKNVQLSGDLLAFNQISHLPKTEINYDFTLTKNKIKITYLLEANLDEILIPDYQRAFQNQVGENLWQHSCFELFVGYEASNAYEEWNFSPAGNYAHYSFLEYRRNSPQTNCQFTSNSIWQRSKNLLQLTQHIDFISLPAKINKINVSAVLEYLNNEKNYMAIKHNLVQADFHLQDNWLSFFH